MSFLVRLLGVCWPAEIKHSFWLLFSTWRDSHNGRLFSAATLPDLPLHFCFSPITPRDPGKDENLAAIKFKILPQEEKAAMAAKMQQLKVAFAKQETR